MDEVAHGLVAGVAERVGVQVLDGGQDLHARADGVNAHVAQVFVAQREELVIGDVVVRKVGQIALQVEPW